MYLLRACVSHETTMGTTSLQTVGDPFDAECHCLSSSLYCHGSKNAHSLSDRCAEMSSARVSSVSLFLLSAQIHLPRSLQDPAACWSVGLCNLLKCIINILDYQEQVKTEREPKLDMREISFTKE